MNNSHKMSMSAETYSGKRGKRFACGRELISRRSPCALSRVKVTTSGARVLYLVGILASIVCACHTPSTEQAALPRPPKMGQVVIQWPIEHGVNVYGFNIYRGESAQGPFTHVNADIIPAATSKDKEYYRYVDKPLELGKTYFYYIESISYAGQKRKITPVIPVNAVP